MIIDTRKFILPLHTPPQLHRDALLMSFENQWMIRKAFNEIIGLHEIDHISLNIVDPRGDMSFLSFNPALLYSTFQEGTYLYNGSISSTYYKNLDFYTWEQCYDRRFFTETKNSLQMRHGIETGLCLVIRQFGFHILATFASKNKKNQLIQNVSDNKTLFYKMAFHCFDLLKEIYFNYYPSEDVYRLTMANYFKKRMVSEKEALNDGIFVS